VKLMPPSYVKAYLKRSKNDANDAAAICEAVTRPSMRFVPIKSEQQQSGLMLHRSRQLLVRQRTMLSNAIRGHMAELGIISAKGRNGTAELLEAIANADDDRIPAVARLSLDAHWLPRWVIGKRSRRAAILQPGSGLFPSSIRRVAKIDSAGSQSRAIDICDGSSSRELWLSSDTRGNTVQNGSGSRVSWNAGRSGSLPSHWLTRLHASPGP
jgi:hypothetical protein